MKNCSIDTVLSIVCCFFIFCISFTCSLNSDALSLLALKASISEDPKHALISWSDSDSSPCKWGGIICDDDNQNRVTSISLSGKNLKGYIPSEIGALSFLAFLDLSQNSFSGPLPHQISNLQSLVHLDISSNNFSGSLPQGLSNLTHLRGTLNLSYNAFSAEIPESFGRFPVMVSLDLRHNNLTGKIPQVGSLLNQGPTAFSGNPFLCGFPSNTLCAEPEAPNPRFLDNPQKPGISSNGLAGNGKMKSGMVTVSVISGVSVAVMGMVFVSVWLMRRKWKMEGKMRRENVSMEMGLGGREKAEKGKFVVVDEGFGLELEDLLRASAYVLGKSRSGIVYKVVVSGGKGMVGPVAGGPSVVAAVRRLSEGDLSWRFKEFEAEVEAIVKVQHPNIVRLKAYYYANDEKLLISDYIGNGSLHNALHGPSNNFPPLSWAARLRIAQEAARGVMYIHESSHRKYIHGNIKTSKILLDDDLKPLISGFGLSRLVPAGTSNAASRKQNPSHTPQSSISSAAVMYVAPEARGAAGSRLTQKCDVYSFGIVLLEILTGRLADGVEGVVREIFREERALSEIIDPTLLHEVQAKKQVVAVFHIALNCTELDPELRPKMRMVSDNLDSIKLE
ncbi:Leucine-rich repeat protein kinase family protein [Perilla frutescens var. hirtella]|nr:Leucine-rich repeat protein kinase family protein [Perilla frutescens var. frutescens]KAH6794636.1 Leucine-rich repeat protein kinase family protein [Perilla frutescens var. hirtella]